MKKMYEIENTLRSLLRSNIVAFTYRKVNGEIRHAIGTRNLTLASAYTNTRIPTPTGDMQPNSYYDVQSNGWRSWKTGYVISIDGQAEMPKRTAEIPVEMTAREIPISKPTTGGVSGGKPMGGADIDNLGGLLGGLLGGFGGGIPKEEIRKSMDKLGKDIVIGAPAHTPKVGTPVSGGKVGTPTFTDKGLELEMGIGVEDFAKMVAHYVVEEFISRIKSIN
jgi:hypothetical protein